MGKQARIASRNARAIKAAAQRQARFRIATAAGGVVIVGLLVAIVISLVNAGGRAPASTQKTAGTQVAPANATAAGALLIGQASAPVRLQIYLDYMCPYCGRFERANASELQRLVTAGTVRIELTPLSFLDKAANGTRYSTRAANAIATVADQAPAMVLAFNNALFAGQPSEGSSGLSDAEIAGLARNAGVPAEVVSRFPAATFEPWIGSMTEASLRAGITSTPTVLVNGVRFAGDLYTAGPLTEAIRTAAGR